MKKTTDPIVIEYRENGHLYLLNRCDKEGCFRTHPLEEGIQFSVPMLVNGAPDFSTGVIQHEQQV